MSTCPSRHLLVQSQQLKHQNNVWNMFKVNNKDSRTTSLTLFWCFHCRLWTSKCRLGFCSVDRWKPVEINSSIQDALQSSYYEIFLKIQRKRPVLEYLYLKLHACNLQFYEESTQAPGVFWRVLRNIAEWVFT